MVYVLSPRERKARCERFMALTKSGANGGVVSRNMRESGFSEAQCKAVVGGLDDLTRKAYDAWVNGGKEIFEAGLRSELNQVIPAVEVPRDNRGLWVKGQSANPAGRPRYKHIKEAMKARLETEGAESVAAVPFDIALSPKARPGERLTAFAEIRDTCEGRPTQSVFVSNPMTEETARRLAEMAETLLLPTLDYLDYDYEAPGTVAAEELAEARKSDIPNRKAALELPEPPSVPDASGLE